MGCRRLTADYRQGHVHPTGIRHSLQAPDALVQLPKRHLPAVKETVLLLPKPFSQATAHLTELAT